MPRGVTTTLAVRLTRLERRRRREELALARRHRLANASGANLEFRLGALVELAGGAALPSPGLDDWLRRAVGRLPSDDGAMDALRRRGDERLLEAEVPVRAAADGVGVDADAVRVDRTRRRIERGAQAVRAGLDALSPALLVGLLTTTPLAASPDDDRSPDADRRDVPT